MTDTIAPSRRVVLQFSAHSVDVLIPNHVAVADALRSVGVDPTDPTVVVVTSDGARLDLRSTAGDVLRDGAVLHVSAIGSRAVGPPAAPSRVAGHADARGATVDATGARTVVAPLPQVLLVALAGACAFVVVMVWAVPTLVPVDPLSVVRQQVVAGAFLLAALVLGLWPTVRQSGRNEICIVVAALLACAGGASAVDPTLAAASQLAVVAAFVSASAVAALAAVRARSAGGDGLQAALVLATLFAVFAVVAGAVLFLEMPAWVTAAVLLGLVPLGLRVLPSFSLQVPVVYLVDAAHVTRSALSVRGGPAQPSPALRNPVVEGAVGRGDRLLAAGTVALSATAAVMTPFVLLDAPPTGTEGVASLVLVLLVAFALVSMPRTARSSASKAAPRAAAATMLLSLVLETAFLDRPSNIIALACSLTVLGLLIAFVSGPISRGRRSVGLSRLTDGFEGLAVTLSLPAALVTIGTIETVRSAFSG